MSQQLGDFAVGSTVRFMWDSCGQDGASITPSSAGSLRVYKDSSTTERSSANGITDTRAFDGLVGIHHVAVDLSDNSDAGFYAAGSIYFVVLAASTIDTKTVNAVLAQFSIESKAPFVAIPASPTADSINERMKTLDDAYTATRAGYLDRVNTALPNAVAGANGGLPTTNGSKLNQTADLTAGQSIAASSVPAVTLANGAHGGVGATITLQTPIEANVASETNHDFTALQKTSLNAATPASIQSFGTLVSDIASAIWGATSRTLSAFGFTVAATVADKTGCTLTSDYDAAKSAASQSSVNALGTPLQAGNYTAPDNAGIAALPTLSEIEASTVLAKAADVPSATSNADALLDRANGVETGWTVRQWLRVMGAAIAGKLSGGGTSTETMRDVTDTKARIVATVDSSGNRSAITYTKD